MCSIVIYINARANSQGVNRPQGGENSERARENNSGLIFAFSSGFACARYLPRNPPVYTRGRLLFIRSNYSRLRLTRGSSGVCLRLIYMCVNLAGMVIFFFFFRLCKLGELSLNYISNKKTALLKRRRRRAIKYVVNCQLIKIALTRRLMNCVCIYIYALLERKKINGDASLKSRRE